MALARRNSANRLTEAQYSAKTAARVVSGSEHPSRCSIASFLFPAARESEHRTVPREETPSGFRSTTDLNRWDSNPETPGFPPKAAAMPPASALPSVKV